MRTGAQDAMSAAMTGLPALTGSHSRNGRPEAVIISVSDLETIEETLDLLSTPGAIDEIRTAEAEIARGEAIGADELRRLMAERVRNERDAG